VAKHSDNLGEPVLVLSSVSTPTPCHFSIGLERPIVRALEGLIRSSLPKTVAFPAIQIFQRELVFGDCFTTILIVRPHDNRPVRRE
jgi:hypothetical protein